MSKEREKIESSSYEIILGGYSFHTPHFSENLGGKNNHCIVWRIYKGKTLHLWANVWDRKAHKNSAKYLKANINFMFCVINATVNTLTERFLRGEKILTLSSSDVYLSFAILNTFKKIKGVIKILVYSSVIDINQMDVILCTMNITSG